MKYKLSEMICFGLIIGIYLIPKMVLGFLRDSVSVLDRFTIPLANFLRL